MKAWTLGLTLLFIGCQRYSTVEHHLVIYSPKFNNGPPLLDSNAVVIISTFGGLINTVSDYRYLPLDTKISKDTEQIKIACPLISVEGGYYEFIITRDSFYDGGTFREECTDHFGSKEIDTIKTDNPLPTQELVNATKDYTEGWHNRRKFYSSEMRPLLLALRHRACEISDSNEFFKPDPFLPKAQSRNFSEWKDVKKILSVPDSCK